MCACKGNSTRKQVSSVKQIVKKPSMVFSTSSPKKNIPSKRVIFKGHM